MAAQNIQQVTEQFLQDLVDAGLVIDQIPNQNERENLRRAEQNITMDVRFESALVSIQGYYNGLTREEKINFIPNNEYIAFNKMIAIAKMNTNAEEIKIYLKAILRPDNVFDNDTMYGQLMNHLFERLGYNDQRRREMRERFFVELRNSISHVDYEITVDEFTYRRRNGTTETLTNQQLFDVVIEYARMITTINNFITARRAQRH